MTGLNDMPDKWITGTCKSTLKTMQNLSPSVCGVKRCKLHSEKFSTVSNDVLLRADSP